MKGRVNMKELTLQQQCEIQGGSLIATALLYLILGEVYGKNKSSRLPGSEEYRTCIFQFRLRREPV